MGSTNASTASDDHGQAELIAMAQVAGNRLTAEHCASKKMETPKVGSAHPVRVGREEPYSAAILVAK
jgi:hypothetical protein